MTRRAVALVLGGPALALLAAGAVVASAPPSAAHEVDPSIRTVIDEVDPVVSGLTIEVGTSVTTQLLLANDTDEVVEVLDEDQPFVRIGPAGVEANLAAPAWYLTNQPFGAASVPDGAHRDAPPRWARVSEEPAWGWFDHRLHPTAVEGGLGAAPLPRFEVPMRHGGRDLVVRGHLERRTTIPRFAAELTALPAAGAGLVVQLLDGRAPGLFLRYDGAGQAVVEGADGEPFLRLGPAGAEVNRRSPTWRFSAQARGEDLTGADTDPSAEPDWAVASSSPSYAWLDPRALIADVGDDPVVREWTVPVGVDGQVVAIAGRSTARLAPIEEVAGAEPPGGGPGRALPVVVVLTGLTVAAAVRLARGRR